MKKIIRICIIGVMAISLLSACSLFDNKHETQTRNGMLLIGNEQPLQDIVNQYKNKIQSNAVYKIKQSTIEDLNTLILKRDTAEELVKQGLLRRPKNVKSPTFSDSYSIQSLPDVEKDTALLLSRYDSSENVKRLKEVTMNDIKFKAQHDDPAWFGYIPDPSFETVIAIVSDEMFNKIPVPETSMATLHLKKTYGSLRDEVIAPDASDSDALKTKTEWLRLTKDIKEHVKHLQSISFLEK
ncbi:lipoprotein BA_5634 family protein [Peribacillus sp. R9-11]|uniref:lipoprotein BA_5634 family protein n=1 Tax=Peribacillus sp. R9-11 TaxID=3073271 RepID=UPI0028685F14|nr:lipoprotein BA_5634 family protein [Peribacillus sp. R9-11]WMX58183.1 lipoprotein BA_5634 family protein [Peribacillus sp. R9-11]